MDTPVTRSKHELIDHYCYGLLDYSDLDPAQMHTIRVILGLVYNEAVAQSRQAIGQQDSRIADLERQVRALQTALQEMEAKATTVSIDNPIPLNGTAPTHEPAEPPAMPQQLQPAAPAGHRRGGRKPGSGNKRGPYKKKGATADEIARQLEGAVVQDAPIVGRIDSSLISDDPNVVALNGTLRREESRVTTQNGIPVRVTRQYIEIR